MKKPPSQEASRLLIHLRGLLLIYDILMLQPGIDTEQISTAFRRSLRHWSVSAREFLERAYGSGMELLGLPISVGLCRERARSKIADPLLDPEAILSATAALEDAAYVLRAAENELLPPPGGVQASPMGATPEPRRCGPLRRDADGRWWYDDISLGRDNEPAAFCFSLASNIAMVTLRLAGALDECSRRLAALGQPDASSVLARFEAWRVTSRWPDLVEEVRLLGRRNERE